MSSRFLEISTPVELNYSFPEIAAKRRRIREKRKKTKTNDIFRRYQSEQPSVASSSLGQSDGDERCSLPPSFRTKADVHDSPESNRNRQRSGAPAAVGRRNEPVFRQLGQPVRDSNRNRQRSGTDSQLSIISNATSSESHEEIKIRRKATRRKKGNIWRRLLSCWFRHI